MKTKPGKLTIKQRKYIRNRVLGLNQKDSAVLAGYSPGTNVTAVVENKPLVAKTLKEAMEKVGLTSDYMAGFLKRGLRVKRSNFTTDKKIPDHDVRQRYAHLILRARGDIDGGNANTVNLGIIQVPGTEKSLENWTSQEEPS